MLFSGIAPALRPENTRQRARLPADGVVAPLRMHSAMLRTHSACLLQRWRAASQGNQVSRQAHAACYTTRVACRAIRPRVGDKAESARDSTLAARVRKYSPSPHMVCWHAAKQRLASPFLISTQCLASKTARSVFTGAPALPIPSATAARARYGELWVTLARGPLTCSRLALAKWRSWATVIKQHISESQHAAQWCAPCLRLAYSTAEHVGAVI
jgi:hypothetical protein